MKNKIKYFPKTTKKCAQWFDYNFNQFYKDIIREILNGYVHDFVEDEVLPNKEEGYFETQGSDLICEVINNSGEIDSWFGGMVDKEEIADYLNNDSEVIAAFETLFNELGIEGYNWAFVGNEEFDTFFLIVSEE